MFSNILCPAAFEALIASITIFNKMYEFNELLRPYYYEINNMQTENWYKTVKFYRKCKFYCSCWAYRKWVHRRKWMEIQKSPQHFKNIENILFGQRNSIKGNFPFHLLILIFQMKVKISNMKLALKLSNANENNSIFGFRGGRHYIHWVWSWKKIIDFRYCLAKFK